MNEAMVKGLISVGYRSRYERREEKACQWTIPSYGVGVSALVLLGLFLLCLLFPYTGDDWFWGSSFGLEQLRNGFANYNGRYVGNLIVLVLTRCRLLRALVISLTLYGICWCVNGIVGRDDSSAFWISLALLLSMPSSVRAQGVAWTSGFVNYAIPSLLVLFYLYSFRDVFVSDGRPEKTRFSGSLFLLGLINSLIMENVSIYNVAVSIGMIVFTRIKFGFYDKRQLSFLFGSCVGCALMFSNGAYYAAATGQSDYQKLNKGPLVKSMISKFCLIINPDCCLRNTAINVIFAVCSFSYYQKRRTPKSLVTCVTCRGKSPQRSGRLRTRAKHRSFKERYRLLCPNDTDACPRLSHVSRGGQWRYRLSDVSFNGPNRCAVIDSQSCRCKALPHYVLPIRFARMLKPGQVLPKPAGRCQYYPVDAVHCVLAIHIVVLALWGHSSW